MFGKRGGGRLPANKPIHEVMTRAMWPAGGGFAGAYRDHMIAGQQRRLTEKLPKPFKPATPTRPR